MFGRKRLGRTRACVVCLQLALVGGALVVSPPEALANTYSVPPPTTSIYEHDASTSNLYSQGETAAKAGQHGDVFLDFGRPAVASGTYGTIDFGGHFDSFGAIRNAAQSYADAYWTYSNHSLYMNISIGTNDSCTYHGYCYSSGGTAYYCGVNTTCTDLVPSSGYTAFGNAWGSHTNALQNYIATVPAYTNEYGEAADDAEPGFDKAYTNTYNSLAGYNATGNNPLADFGSLDGGPCCSAWTVSQQFQVAYGFADDFPAPEIYNSSMASQWTSLAKWTYQNKGYNLFIEIVTSENGYGGTFTTAQSYNTLETDLANCSCGEAPSGSTKIPDTTHI